MKKKILPRTPSALIRLAIGDLNAVEKMKKRFRVDMGTWHEHYDNKCNVCFAGAVMARRMDVKDEEMVTPNDFPANANQLAALNRFREGSVSSALETLGINLSDGIRPKNRNVTDYSRHKGKFKRAMLKLADEFEGVGL